MGVTLISPTASHGGLNWDTNLETNLATLAAGINGSAGVPSNDLNAITLGGVYFGSGLSNAPLGDSGYWWVHDFLGPDASNQAQVAHSLSLKSSWRRFAVGGTWTAWVRIDAPDTGWSLSPIVAASGWGTKTDPSGNTSSLTGGVRRYGELVEYRFRLNRSGADVVGTASGNIVGDPTIATVNPSTFPQYVPTTVVEDRFGVVGVQAGTARMDQTGAITISDIYPNDSISNGSTIQVTLRFLAD